MISGERRKKAREAFENVASQQSKTRGRQPARTKSTVEGQRQGGTQRNRPYVEKLARSDIEDVFGRIIGQRVIFCCSGYWFTFFNSDDFHSNAFNVSISTFIVKTYTDGSEIKCRSNAKSRCSIQFYELAGQISGQTRVAQLRIVE